MKISEAVALRLSKLLQERKMSQYRLEKIAAIPHNTMKTLMAGKNSGVNLKTIMQITKGLETSVSNFFDDPIFESADIELY